MELQCYHVDETYESVFMSPKDRLGTLADPRHRILHNHFSKTKANLGSRKWQEGRPRAWKP